MRFSKRQFFSRALGGLILFSFFAACSGGSGSSGGGGGGSNNSSQAAVTPVTFTGTSYPVIGVSGGNTMTIGVNDSSQCGSNSGAQVNLPCVTVTICAINAPTTCQTINNILLDTGSYGLRVFKSVINSSVLAGMVPVTNGSNQLGECVVYGDGSSDWGPVEYAYVQLGGEPKVGVPIQVIDSTFQSLPSLCSSPNSTPDTGPTTFNGILGVGYKAQDCGSSCVTNGTSGGGYFTCLNGSCNSGTYGGALVTLNAQVTNPVSALPSDNNGVSITLPSVGSSGVSSVTGTMKFGLNSSTVSGNPMVLLVTTVSGSSQNGFTAVLGSSYPSTNASMAAFFDTGSNFLYFNNSSITQCTDAAYAGIYCPSSSSSFTVTNVGSGRTNTQTLSIGNASTLVSGSNYVFSNIGASLPTNLSTVFDYGLPFFFGKTIYVGISGTTSSALSATGPYFAY